MIWKDSDCPVFPVDIGDYCIYDDGKREPKPCLVINTPDCYTATVCFRNDCNTTQVNMFKLTKIEDDEVTEEHKKLGGYFLKDECPYFHPRTCAYIRCKTASKIHNGAIHIPFLR